MNPDWKSFLLTKGAAFIAHPDENIEAQQLVFFAKPELEMQISTQDLLLCNSSERGVIKVSGADAESFLQNQLTNDVRKLEETNHQESAWCSPKGRIIANFQLYRSNDAIYLGLSADLIPHVIKKLRMYVMMSKVVIEDLTDSIVQFTFAGNKADAQVQAVLGDSFKRDAEVLKHNSATLLRSEIAGKTDFSRFDVFVEDIEEAKTLWSYFEQHATSLSGNGLRYLNILAGKPEITAQSTEAWIPQMVNYIQLSGVDFKKGCYPGQEVVARLNYLGKTKRRMYRLEIASNELPDVGAEIKSENDAQAGKILNAVLHNDGKVDALAILKIAESDTPLTLVNSDAKITVLDLPYGIDDE